MKLFTLTLMLFLGFGAFLTPTNATETEPELTDRQRLIAEARADTASEMEQRIAADGLVTPEEYEEAVHAYLACMQDRGYTAVPEQDPYRPGFYNYDLQPLNDTSDLTEEEEADRTFDAIQECQTGTLYLIGAIYSLQITNPNDEDHSELLLACLINHEVLEPGEITVQQLDTEMQNESPDFPFRLMDEQVTSCLTNPSQNGLNGNPLRLPSVEATPEPSSARQTRQQQVAKAQKNPESELEERVLADGVVTHKEYDEAVAAYRACMADAGYEVKTTPAMFMPGMYQYEVTFGDDPSTPVPDSEFEKLQEADMGCSIGTTYTIEAIYGLQISNPDDLPIMELTLACLVDKDLVEENSLTPIELEIALQEESPDLPFDMWDMEVISCLVNPAQNGLNDNPLIEITPVATPSP